MLDLQPLTLGSWLVLAAGVTRGGRERGVASLKAESPLAFTSEEVKQMLLPSATVSPTDEINLLQPYSSIKGPTHW